MTSYKSVNLISIKVHDSQIYLKTTNRGFLNEYEASSKVFVYDGQNRLSFQRQLFTADRSRYVEFATDEITLVSESKNN